MTISRKPLLLKKDIDTKPDNFYHTYQGGRTVAFFDKEKVIYNEKLAKYEIFRARKDIDFDSMSDKELEEIDEHLKQFQEEDKDKDWQPIYQLFLSIQNPKDLTSKIVRKAVKKVLTIKGDRVEVDEKEYYKPAYEKYLDFKKGNLNTLSEEEKQLKQETIKQQEEIAKLQEEIKKLRIQEENKKKEVVESANSDLSKEKEKGKLDDATNNISKHRKKF